MPEFWSVAGRDLRTEGAAKGQAWFWQSWLDREKKFFALSGEVALTLGAK